MGEQKEVFGIRIAKSKKEEIEAAAEAEGITPSEFARRAIDRALGEELLADRVELLEEAVTLLLEDNAPSEELEYVNSPYLNLLQQLHDG